MQWQQERAWFTQVFLQWWSLPSVLTVYHSGQWYILAFVQKAKILLGTSLKFYLPVDQLLSQLGWNWRSQYLQTVGTRPGSALMEEWGRSCVMEIVCEAPPASIQYHQYALRYKFVCKVICNNIFLSFRTKYLTGLILWLSAFIGMWERSKRH